MATRQRSGRWLITAGVRKWIDGPLTRAVREGGICYVVEVGEARRDGIVIKSVKIETPVKNTDVTLGRLEELTPETVSAAIDGFLVQALNA